MLQNGAKESNDLFVEMKQQVNNELKDRGCSQILNVTDWRINPEFGVASSESRKSGQTEYDIGVTKFPELQHKTVSRASTKSFVFFHWR
jgi:hypothetical protein